MAVETDQCWFPNGTYTGEEAVPICWSCQVAIRWLMPVVVVSLDDWCSSLGDRCDAKARSRCEVCFLRGVSEGPFGLSRRSCRVCSLNGGGAYKACHRCRSMSPCPVVVGVFLYPGCTPVVPVD